jgi:hypothetical protein
MKTRLKKMLSVIAILMIVLVVVVGILVGVYITKGVSGLLSLPGMSAVLGLDRPKDLGMGTLTDADRASLVAKIGGNPDAWPDAASSTSRKPLLVTLTPKELAEFLMSGKGSETFHDLQLEIQEGNLIAASAVVRIDGVLAVADMSRSDIEEQVGTIPDEVPIYLELTADPTEDGSLGIGLRQLKIGSITVPGSSFGLDPSQLDPYVRDFFNVTYGVVLNSLSTDGTNFILDMDVPQA